MSKRSFWLIVAILIGLTSVSQAQMMAPQMPRKGTDKPKQIPPAPMLKWEKKMLNDDLNEGIAVFDVNKDGKLDITAGANWYPAPDFKPRPIREVAQTGKKGNEDEFMHNNGEHAYDVNQDGWTDIISGSWFSDKIYWYENPKKKGLRQKKLWQAHLIAEGHTNCEGVLLEDLDGDNVPEIIINSWDAKRNLKIIKMTPGPTPKFETIDLGSPGKGHGMAIGDINGDKRKDIIVAGGWFEQPAENVWSTPWTFHQEECCTGHGSLPGQVFDLNGDGRNDVLIGHGHDFGLYWYEQGSKEEGRTKWTQHLLDDSFSQIHCVQKADLDGDGKPEFITGKRWRGHRGLDPGANQPVCLFRYIWDPIGPKFTQDTISFDDGVGTGMQIRVADLNQDGKPDIAVAGKSGTYILFNRGKADKSQAAAD